MYWKYFLLAFIPLQMRLAKAEKRFNKCSLLQRDLEELDKLTEALPTVADLEDELRYVTIASVELILKVYRFAFGNFNSQIYISCFRFISQIRAMT